MSNGAWPLVWDGTGEPPTVSPWGPSGRAATLTAVAALSKLWLTALNRTTCAGCDRLYEAVANRPAGQPLLTVSNHASTLDDPTLFCAMLPLRFFATEPAHGRVRWTLCATEICHANKLLSHFFRAGKTLPISRGAGLEQPVLRLVEEQLRHGAWVHVFPEGKVRQDGLMNPLKTGFAQLLCGASDASPPPLVVPFHHRGMSEAMRVKSWPRVNKHVDIVVGAPIDMTDLLLRCRKARRVACGKIQSYLHSRKMKTSKNWHAISWTESPHHWRRFGNHIKRSHGFFGRMAPTLGEIESVLFGALQTPPAFVLPFLCRDHTPLVVQSSCQQLW